MLVFKMMVRYQVILQWTARLFARKDWNRVLQPPGLSHLSGRTIGLSQNRQWTHTQTQTKNNSHALQRSLGCWTDAHIICSHILTPKNMLLLLLPALCKGTIIIGGGVINVGHVVQRRKMQFQVDKSHLHLARLQSAHSTARCSAKTRLKPNYNIY